MVEAKIPLMKPKFYKDLENAPANALWDEHFVLGESDCEF